MIRYWLSRRKRRWGWSHRMTVTRLWRRRVDGVDQWLVAHDIDKRYYDRDGHQGADSIIGAGWVIEKRNEVVRARQEKWNGKHYSWYRDWEEFPSVWSAYWHARWELWHEQHDALSGFQALGYDTVAGPFEGTLGKHFR